VTPRRLRLDALLAERGLFASRSRAAAAVLAGDVMLGAGRERASKPGQSVTEDVIVAVDAAPAFVSRGGVKLANAVAAFGLGDAIAGSSALDVGVSTGGFTDFLLQHGAARVAAVDVAYGQIDYRLRVDDRVTLLERCNARELTAETLPFAPGLIVIDVSFISLTKVLDAVLACAAPRFDCLAMVKPQFEVGRERVGKGGVVRDLGLRRSAVASVAAFGIGLGASVRGFASSGLPGPKGNRETFVWLAEGSRAGGVSLDGLDAAVAVAEPEEVAA
jgi:23S rRNA (cytidine1920-2'-O)/16S rRNA (cytidine1409-2'-O)-methyltransferase